MRRKLYDFINHKEISKLLETLDDNTKKHSIRTGLIAKYIAEELKYSKSVVNYIARAAFFHDVGKRDIPKWIINKPEKLTKNEYDLIKKHSQFGYEILMNEGLPFEAEIILQHHELLDGSGYPLGLDRNSIFQPARIITIVDVFDALIEYRPYRNEIHPDKALLYLYENSNEKFELNLVKFLHKILKEKSKELNIDVSIIE